MITELVAVPVRFVKPQSVRRPEANRVPPAFRDARPMTQPIFKNCHGRVWGIEIGYQRLAPRDRLRPVCGDVLRQRRPQGHKRRVARSSGEKTLLEGIAALVVAPEALAPIPATLAEPKIQETAERRQVTVMFSELCRFDGAHPLDACEYWRPFRSGDSQCDYSLGKELFSQTLAYCCSYGSPLLLMYIVNSVAGLKIGQVERGFIEALTSKATVGANSCSRTS